MKKVTIGVLAGMGPRSTSPFLELLLDQCQEQYGATYDIDYPQIIIYSLPTPFYIDQKTDEEELKRSIKDGVERLQTCGVDIIGIPCNSAHVHFAYITENSSVPILNIVNETMKGIKKGSIVSVFATEMTIKSGLYQDAMKQMECEYLFLNEWQESINKIILRIKNKDLSITTKQMWNELILEAHNKGVEKIILACTDLNVVIDSSSSAIEFVDSSKALAKGLINKYLELAAQ